MDLLLWRHAEAEDGHPDLLRKLTPRGERQARQIADWIRANAPTDLRIVVSPADRCQQTAWALGLPFDTDPRLGTGAGVAELLAAADWPGDGSHKRGAVLLVGHQPTLGQVARKLAQNAETDRPFEKGALWWLNSIPLPGKAKTTLRIALSPSESQPTPIPMAK